MTNIVLKKWIEPYVLLETMKKHYEMKDYVFDGWTKNSAKQTFFKQLGKSGTVGLYMKNVNKFYVFSNVSDFDIVGLFGFAPDDYRADDDSENALNLVDLGKAEAAFLIFG